METRLFQELPVPNGEAAAGEPGHAIFVGALERRKGVSVLMDAWPLVEANMSNAVLTILGSGVLEAEVIAWCAERPTSRRYLGLKPRPEAVIEVSRHAALIAPSIPAGRWREQIGLPIKEALAGGLTVVTTDETGLSPWLRANGHRVLPLRDDNSPVSSLARAVEDALSNPLDRAGVRSSLPEQDTRLEAERWLHGATAGEPLQDAITIVNPLGGTLAHYTSALQKTLDKGGRQVNVVSIMEPSASGVTRAAWLFAYVRAVRGIRKEAKSSGSHRLRVIVTWPVLGWLDALMLSLLLPRTATAALVVHDPVPLVKALGYSRASARAAALLARKVTPLVHSTAALADLPPGRLSSSARLVLHPIQEERTRQTRLSTSTATTVRVLGQYKPDRDVEIMTALARKSGLADVSLEVVGRGWPAVPGWTIDDRFVPEEELDRLIESSSAVLIPYHRFYQSGIAVRALELGTPVVGPRDSSLQDLFEGADDLLVAAGEASLPARAGAWEKSIRAALDSPANRMAEMRAGAVSRTTRSWQAWLESDQR
jgi:glycosyltransferase involved in cell wall biosynthesis